MLSSLPTELLRQIIESTIPHTFHSQTYSDRQVTLRRLSLVSHRFRQVAQLLLFEIVSIQSPEKLEKVIDTIESKGSSAILREVICWMEEGKGTFGGGNLERFVRTGHNLRTIVLRLVGQGTEVIDLSILQLLPQLEHLRLSGNKLEITSPFTLPRLHTLSVSHSALAAVKTLLDPVYLPSLKHLGLPDTDTATDFDPLQHSNVDKLIPQLDSISLYWRCVDCAPVYLRTCIERTLFDCYSWDLEGLCLPSPLLRHLRILSLPLEATRKELSSWINRVANWIETHQQLSLRSLYLDSMLHPTALILNSQSAKVQDGMSYLLKVCREKNVEVVFESQPQDWEVDPVLSEEFCRRQCELR